MLSGGKKKLLKIFEICCFHYIPTSLQPSATKIMGHFLLDEISESPKKFTGDVLEVDLYQIETNKYCLCFQEGSLLNIFFSISLITLDQKSLFTVIDQETESLELECKHYSFEQGKE